MGFGTSVISSVSRPWQCSVWISHEHLSTASTADVIGLSFKTDRHRARTTGDNALGQIGSATCERGALSIKRHLRVLFVLLACADSPLHEIDQSITIVQDLKVDAIETVTRFIRFKDAINHDVGIGLGGAFKHKRAVSLLPHQLCTP